MAACEVDDGHFSKQSPAPVKNVHTACQNQPAAQPHTEVPGTIDGFSSPEEKLQKKKKTARKTETVFSPDNLKFYYLTKEMKKVLSWGVEGGSRAGRVRRLSR